MRRFSDSHLKPSLKDFEQMTNMIKKSAMLGFQIVGLSLPSNIGVDDVSKLQRVCRDIGVELAPRVDLAPRSRSELLSGLRRLRRRFELVSVFCASKVVARQAARDRRVDLLSFPVADYPKVFFDRADAELASNAMACLEIDTQPLLSLNGYARVRLLSILRREVTVAKSFNVPIVLSSGATDTWFLRKPQDLASLGVLVDLDLPLALESLSDIPLKIVERNRRKLSPDHVVSGVRVVRR